MINETTVTLQGWLGGEVDLRQAAGVPVARFRVAATPRRRSRDGEWSDTVTQWYSVSAWRGLGENCAASLRRGDAVVVHGRLVLQTYLTKNGIEAVDMQVEAIAVGPDLSKGTATFRRPSRPDQVAAPMAEGVAAQAPAA
jgi:single-strand DNA-binding protein